MGKGKKKLVKNNSTSFGEPLDSSMDYMEETRFRKRYQKLILKLSEKLHFTYTELECILLIYYKMKKYSKFPEQGIDKTQLRDVLHCALDMTDDYLMDRIFYTLDKGPSPSMTMEVWASTLSLFLRGTLEEKIRYCFSVYDTINEGILVKETMFNLMRNCVVSVSKDEDADEMAKDLVEVITKKMDIDRRKNFIQ